MFYKTICRPTVLGWGRINTTARCSRLCFCQSSLPRRSARCLWQTQYWRCSAAAASSLPTMSNASTGRRRWRSCVPRRRARRFCATPSVYRPPPCYSSCATPRPNTNTPVHAHDASPSRSATAYAHTGHAHHEMGVRYKR